MAIARPVRTKAQKAAGVTLTQAKAVNSGSAPTPSSTPTSSAPTSTPATPSPASVPGADPKLLAIPGENREQYQARIGYTEPKKEEPTEDSTYVPRYTAREVAEPEAPRSVESLQREKTRAAQGEINALRDYEATLLKEQAVLNNQDERATSSVSTLTGLGGSSEANVQQRQASDRSKLADRGITDRIAVQVQGILSEIRKDAVTEARQSRLDARDDETAYLANQATRRELASKNLAALAASGVTNEGLKKTDPKSYQHLVDTYGSEEAVKGAFVLNTPQDQILDKKIQGSKYIISRQNPITGKVTVEVMDIPGLPDDYSGSVDLGDRIMFYDPSDPQGKQFFMSKGLTPVQASKESTAVTTDSTSSASNVLGTVDEAISQVNIGSAGVIGGPTKNISGSPAYNLVKTIDTLKANLAFDELAKMRAASKTGGALGSITERELDLLGSTVASLDVGQSPEQLKKNLESIRTRYENVQAALLGIELTD